MIKKTTLIQGSSVVIMDTIEHEGELWLVPDWLVLPDGKRMKPLRIISLSKIPHQILGDGFLISHPIPKSVFDGTLPEEEEDVYLIVESPDIILPNPDVLN